MSDLSGKTVLVTGANSGIGLETSVQLAQRGANVVMVARDPGRGAAALEQVKRRSGSQSVSLLLCDFSSQASIRALAEEYRRRHDRLDVLVNNAGLVNDKRRVTEDGLEQTFAVNHLGYFLLTNLLLDLLLESAPSRVVVVASRGHRPGDLDFDNLQYENGGYGVMKAYSRSKLANVLFANELARRVGSRGVTVNSLHPGMVATHIWSGAPFFARPFLALGKRLFMLSAEEGARRVVQLAADPDLEGRGGQYFEDYKPVKPSRLARDESLAARLWAVSEKLVGLA